MLENMDPDDAQKLAKSSVCSDCWGELTVAYNWHTRTSSVSCATPDCPQHGYVSRRFVERREAESAGELAEARVALTRAGALRVKESAQQLLSELGY